MINNKLLANRLRNIVNTFKIKIVTNETQYINTYDMVDFKIKQLNDVRLKIRMGKQLNHTLPKLNIKANRSSEQLPQVTGLVSCVGYTRRYDRPYYTNALAEHIIYPLDHVAILAKQLIQYLWSIGRKNINMK